LDSSGVYLAHASTHRRTPRSTLEDQVETSGSSSPKISQKYPSAVLDSFQLGPFVTFRPRFFRVLCSLVLAPSIKRILVVLAPFLAFFMSTRSSRSVEQFYTHVLFYYYCLVIFSYLFLLFACMWLLWSVESEAFEGFEFQDAPEFEQPRLVEGKSPLMHAHLSYITCI
jgi:hypothetical protein